MWLSAQLQDGGKGGADGRVRGIRVVEVVVRGTRTEGCEAGQFDMAGGTWSERHAHRSRQLLKREGVSSCHDYGGGGDGLRRCGGWARRPVF